jgi:hypothetical protein
MPQASETAGIAQHADSVETFEWRGLHFHVVTPEPMTGQQVRVVRQALSSIASVGRFADLLGIVFERHVTIRTERPTPDVRFEVSR